MTSPKINWISPGDFAGFPPRRAPDTHKGSYGHLMVVAGSLGYHGAAVLAVRGAQRAQPGLVTLLTQEAVYYPVAAQLQSAMVDLWTPDFNRFAPAGAVLMGPGLAAPNLGDDFRTILRRLWRDAAVPVVVDASALVWLAPQTTEHNAVRVITPHPGEAAALLKQPVAQIQADREAALRELSRRHGNCWVVLKGHQTLIGRADGEILGQPLRQPPSGPGRQRRRAVRLHRRPAGATGVAGRSGPGVALRRLAAWRGGGPVAGRPQKLGGGGAGP